jgi:hypothetical protein
MIRKPHVMPMLVEASRSLQTAWKSAERSMRRSWPLVIDIGLTTG